jgi:UDP-N-acetylmuramate: L-alanyl-gamma-D-glutamyl-meso-diaminopimelate ligase
MKIHILGICGTFMGGIAILARSLGHEVSGSDANVYPPMSTQLESQGIKLCEGYLPEHLQPEPDLVVVGNTLSRGNPTVEYVLDNDLNFISGPQWLHDHVLRGRHVLAVSGTHGKTTTSSILAWILEEAGLDPGFSIGGIAENFNFSARLTDSNYFVVEADEYDTAFFDKRSKFIHYQPKTLVINNIEFDHADIFNDISAIKREFHHLIRTIPATGLIIAHHGDKEIEQVLAAGCWTPVEYFAGKDAKWSIRPTHDDFSEFEVMVNGKASGICKWPLIGQHNAENALAAIAAASNIGVAVDKACESLANFKCVKRRLEQLAVVNGVTVYDDFAHHPTAIKATLAGLRQNVGSKRIIAIMEPRSNTMRQGVHKDILANSLTEANYSLLFQPEGLAWDLAMSTKSLGDKCQVFTDVDSIITAAVKMAEADDHIVIMSNGGFEDIHQKLISRLQ